MERLLGKSNSNLSLGGIALGGVWLLAAATGFFLLQVHASRGRDANPQGAVDLPSSLRGKLVVFAHPHCPCFRNSLANFAEIVKSAGLDGKAEVIFVRPEGTPDGWERGRSWKAAENAGLHVDCDVNAELAKRIGATISGETFLFDEAGRCLFRGGIARPGGHAGDNPGSRSILALLRGESPEAASTPAYGCPLE
jgi:hypothetical protein